MPEPTPSKASIKGHPVHPMLIPFPIVLITAALVIDLVYSLNEDDAWASGWATASAWLLAGAAVTGSLATVAGATDCFGVKEVREHKVAKQHAIGNTAILTVTSLRVGRQLRQRGSVCGTSGSCTHSTTCRNGVRGGG